MARGHHTHFELSRETRSVNDGLWEHPLKDMTKDVEVVLTKCGEEHRTDRKWQRNTVEPTHVTCPACLKKMAKDALRDRSADAPKLRMEADKTIKGCFRHNGGWRAYVGDDLVAYLGYEDHGWRIYPLAWIMGENGRPSGVRNDWLPLGDQHGYVERSMHYGLKNALRFPTKDDALLACEDLRANGRLQTEPEILTEREVQKRRAKQVGEQRQREAAEAEQHRNDTLEALREILEKETLSNFQRQGLITAMRQFEPAVHD
jgi:hypothetical protein